MTDTTSAGDDRFNVTDSPERIWLSPQCDEHGECSEGRTWCEHDMGECEECHSPAVEYVRADLLRPQPAGDVAGLSLLERLRMAQDGMYVADAAADAGEVEWLQALIKEAADAIAALTAREAPGWRLVPVEPPIGLLMSMAMRLDHAIGMPGYYDQPIIKTEGVTHARRVEVAIADMRRAYEEIVGYGFYAPEREADYANRHASAAAHSPRRGDDGCLDHGVHRR